MRRKGKIYIALFFATLFVVNIKAQQLNSLSNYMNNNYLVNPAAAGTSSEVSLYYKKWWSGFDGSPTIQCITAQSSINNNNVGLGGKFFNYSTGPISKLGIEGTYSYHLKVSNNSKLALALSLQLYQFYLNKNMLKLEESYDEAIIYSSEKLIVPDAAFGAYYYSDNYYAGISVYQLFNRKVSLLNQDYVENKQIRHYFFTAGYKLKINETYGIEPSLLTKFIETGTLQLDFNLKAIYKDFVWLGVGYRTNEATVINLGVKNEHLAFGYAYDILMNDIRKHSVGSHELMFLYNFGNKSKSKIY